MSRVKREGKYCGYIMGKHWHGSGPKPHKVCASFASIQALISVARERKSLI